jgi:hypothetical protein
LKRRGQEGCRQKSACEEGGRQESDSQEDDRQQSRGQEICGKEGHLAKGDS